MSFTHSSSVSSVTANSTLINSPLLNSFSDIYPVELFPSDPITEASTSTSLASIMLLLTPLPLPPPHPSTLMNSLSWNELKVTGLVKTVEYPFLPPISVTMKATTNATVLVISRFIVASISVPHALERLLIIWCLTAPSAATPLLCLHFPSLHPLPLVQFPYLFLLLDPFAQFITALAEYPLIMTHIVLAPSILLTDELLLLTILMTTMVLQIGMKWLMPTTLALPHQEKPHLGNPW